MNGSTLSALRAEFNRTSGNARNHQPTFKSRHGVMAAATGVSFSVTRMFGSPWSL
jgi:hypothetical protein